MEVTVYDGKYTVIQEESGNVKALRYSEEWRDCCGDGLVLALAQEVEISRDKLIKVREEACKNNHVIYNRMLDAEEKVQQLQDFTIWMTGCGYDFCQHDYFIKQRDTLLKKGD